MKKNSWAIVSVILLLTIVVFFPATQGEYLLNWDDNLQITNNSDVQNLSWQSIKNYFTTFYAASYQPLASFSFGIEYHFFGLNSLVHHVTNLVLHLLNIILVFVLLSKLLTDKKVLIYFVTAAFALHPLQTEMLGWISTRSTLMFSGFFVLACIQYINHVKENNGYKKSYFLAMLFFVLALFCKSTAVIFPILAFTFDYYYKRKVSLKLFLEKAPLFVGSFVFGYLSLLSRKVSESQGDFNDYYTLYEKLSISSYSMFLYLKKALFPYDLNIFYGYPYKLSEGELIGNSFLLAPLWMLLIAIFCFAIYKLNNKENSRLWLFGLSFFFVNIMIVVNVTPFSFTFLAERYMYLGVIGIFIALSAIVNGLISNSSMLKNGIYIALGVYIVVLSVSTRKRSHLWQNEFTLWTYVVGNAETQVSYPYKHLGKIYADKKDHKQAIEIYNKGVKANPYSIDLYYWRGISIAETGDLNYAKIDFGRVINSKDEKFNRQKGNAYYHKAQILKKQNLMDSVQMFMDSAKAYNSKLNLFDGDKIPVKAVQLRNVEQKILSRIDSLLKLKDYTNLITEYDNLSLIAPNNLNYQLEKGKLEIQTNQMNQSITTFSRVIEKDSVNKVALLSRAYVYSIINKNKESIQDYSTVLEKHKDNTGEVYYFRALAFLKGNELSKACQDILKSESLGFKVPIDIKKQMCK